MIEEKRLEDLKIKHSKELEQSRHLGRIETVETIQEKFNLVSLNLMEGTYCSKSSYNNQRHLIGMESYENALKSTIQKGISKYI